MKRKTGTLLIALGMVLILMAAALTGYNFWQESSASERANQALGKLIQKITVSAPTNFKPQATYVPVATQPTDEPEPEIVYPDYVLNPNMPMPVEMIDGFGYIGVVSIPSVQIELPVIDLWSYEALMTAPCRYTGSAYLNDLVIAAHNHNGHFGRLLDARQDDEVTFTDIDGNVFRYRVVEFEAMKPGQVENMITGDWDLTLFTCNASLSDRVAVRCELIEE